MTPVLGVIGGSGSAAVWLEEPTPRAIQTPYGEPSGPVLEGHVATPGGRVRALFIPRHGEGHRLSPSHVNYRANVCAMKQLGATHLVSLSAVGSLKQELCPGDVVLVDQYIDLTKQRPATFFDAGAVAHVSLADPTCPELSGAAIDAARAAGGRVHQGGTYLCIEGPQFSTRAESHLYRSWGASVIGMTAMPEARLAREAELPYATIAFVTDYDCWAADEAAVTSADVLRVMAANRALAERVVRELAARLPPPGESPATGVLREALVTSREHLTDDVKARLAWLLPRG
ncbi:MAG: S-methyl-5'-thioadenosine phosphorylase [Polyangiaceae bacterium]|nr:S-methyl-5'-thioadenosine phosphorylase [Polyangiaceae bacterium]MCW5791132.1 S-methyl-5'-thioadenosine phosphorylase [Polyangiaceae bacterium]